MVISTQIYLCNGIIGKNVLLPFVPSKYRLRVLYDGKYCERSYEWNMFSGIHPYSNTLLLKVHLNSESVGEQGSLIPFRRALHVVVALIILLVHMEDLVFLNFGLVFYTSKA